MGRTPHWFEAVAEHLGPAYLRYSFTRGTEQEVGFLVATLGLKPGMAVLDIGCGPGRHALELTRRGLRVVGLDISARFVRLAADAGRALTGDRPADAGPEGGTAGCAFVQGDARQPPVRPASFDAAISLCQGGFGLLGGPGSPLDEDGRVLEAMAAALRPGGRLAVSAFSAYFQVRFLEDADTFDAEAGVNHEITEVRDEGGRAAPAELWTTCFTPRELRLLGQRAGLDVRHLWSVTPGRYRAAPPDLDQPELLLVAERA